MEIFLLVYNKLIKIKIRKKKEDNCYNLNLKIKI
jgi:hypothetical protein